MQIIRFCHPLNYDASAKTLQKARLRRFQRNAFPVLKALRYPTGAFALFRRRDSW